MRTFCLNILFYFFSTKGIYQNVFHFCKTRSFGVSTFFCISPVRWLNFSLSFSSGYLFVWRLRRRKFLDSNSLNIFFIWKFTISSRHASNLKLLFSNFYCQVKGFFCLSQFSRSKLFFKRQRNGVNIEPKLKPWKNKSWILGLQEFGQKFVGKLYR